jgi:asparagine synthase (glutamine-hydrolysing)
MCGISGIATFEPSGVPMALLQQMTAALRHRGPDDHGSFQEKAGRAALGHRRLSIIDLSSGHQPVFNEDGQIAVVFNGEIYNYQELRRDLEARGHRFRTHSDTEVIVHLYEDRGADCVQLLRGMFAFAVWDGRTNTVMLARDRLGKKPTYYAVLDGILYFASEIQALYCVPGLPTDLDYEAIDRYLTYSYIPSPHSVYRSIRKLPPAHTLTFDCRGLRLARYWRPDYTRKTTLSYEDATAELVKLLTESVRLRLISDVPLGAFLSGGVDSSTVVALMAKLSNAPVKTFSIGFADEEFNELSFARQVAEQYGTDHHEFVVEPERLNILEDIVRHYGEPYGDSSAVPTWHLSRLTRQHVTVALNGDGGDELFGGYDWYRMQRRVNRTAFPLAHWTAGHLNRLGRSLMPRRVAKGVELLARPEASRFHVLHGYAAGSDLAPLYHPEFRSRLATAAEDYLTQLYDASLPCDADRSFSADLLSYLPEDLLVKVDRASMAHSLECRSPFLDQELVEFSTALPSDWKIGGGRSKRILKDAVRDLFPTGFLDRPKMGFSVPIGKWFRGELKGFIADALLHGPLVRLPLLQPAAVKQLLDEHASGTRNHETQIWNLLMLNLWFHEFRP